MWHLITYLFTSTLIGNECVGYAKGGVITKVYSWFAFAMSGLLSLILLIYFNSVIIQKVRQSRKMFENKETSVKRKNQGLNVTNQKRQKAI